MSLKEKIKKIKKKLGELKARIPIPPPSFSFTDKNRYTRKKKHKGKEED